jgi:hypothetical protein
MTGLQVFNAEKITFSQRFTGVMSGRLAVMAYFCVIYALR